MSSLEELHAGTGIGHYVGASEPILDVVAIHGLNPKDSETHGIDTWQDKKSGNLWLRDKIPLKQPNARVFLYRYNSSPVFGISQGRFIDEANQFLERLHLKRRKDPKRPLLLLGHSLGGILIKQALVNAFNDPKYRSIQEATYGLIFFGTPHGGPGDGWQIMLGKASVRIAQSLPGRTSNDIMEALEKGSLFSDALQNLWRHQLDQYRIVTFYEGIGDIVPQHSTTLGLPGDRESQIKIQAKHGDMCRFDPDVSMDRDNYELVEGNVLELCELASQLGETERSTMKKNREEASDQTSPLDINAIPSPPSHEVHDLERGLDLLKNETVISCLYGIPVGQKDYELALHFLEPHCHNPRRHTISQAHRESFQWIWDTQNPKLEFVNWLRSESPIFWISGKPGAGKSTLMKYLVKSEHTVEFLSEKSDATIVVHYFFHELGESQEKSFGGLLHAIFYQLLIGFHDKNQAALSRLYGLLKPHLGWNLTSKAALPDQVLMEILQRLVAECNETLRLCLLIDGLDECHGDHRTQLTFLTDWVRSSSDKKLCVKACIASRVEPEIILRLSNEPTIAIHQFTRKDISGYVSQKLGQAWDLMARQPDGTTTKYDGRLIDRVVEKAEGVFIWVIIVVSQLVVAIEEEAEGYDLYRLLAELPEGLEKLYASIIDKIEQRFWHDTINFLRIIQERSSWGSYYRTSNILKLSAAILDPMSAITCKPYSDEGFSIDDAGLSRHRCAQVKRRLQRSCRGLIEVQNTKDLPSAKVNLLHRTVEEFAIKSQGFERMLNKVDKKLLRNPCVALMAMNLRLLKSYPEYAQSQGDPLGLRLNDLTRCEPVYELTYRFFLTTRSAERSTGLSQHLYIEELDHVLSLSHPDWSESYYEWLHDETSVEWNTNLLSLAVHYDLTLYVQHQIDRNGKAIIKKAHGRPLLFYAYHATSLSGIDMYEVLLNSGADPMETIGSGTVWSFMVMKLGPDFRYDNRRTRVERIFRLMLEHGADPTQRIVRGISDNGHDSDSDFWPFWPKKLYTTTFHATLKFLGLWKQPKDNKAMLESLVCYCNNLEATDSDGIGIQEWADSLDLEMGAFLQQEIAAKKQRDRDAAISERD